MKLQKISKVDQDRQNVFIDKYLSHFNGTLAAKESGYSERSARAQASRLLTNANIQGKIKKKLKFLSEKAGIDQAYVLERYKRIVEADILDFIQQNKRGPGFKLKRLEDIPETKRFAIKKIKHGQYGLEIELEPKQPSLHDLAQYTKVLDGEKQGDQTLVINQTINYEGLSEDIIKKYGFNKGGEEFICTSESSKERQSG